MDLAGRVEEGDRFVAFELLKNATISAGLNDVVMDHLVDVVDINGAAELVFRTGARKARRQRKTAWLASETRWSAARS